MIRRVAQRSAAIAGEYGTRLSRRISVALLSILAVLWSSGVLWLVLHYLLASPGEFGIIRHPLETPVLVIHGVLALVALFLLGWFAGRHASAAASGRRVASGWLLAVMTAAVVIAGGALLFLTSAAWQAGVAMVHEIMGVALLVPVLAHGWRASAAVRARDRARDAAHAGAHPPQPPARHGGAPRPGRARSARS
jgi:hypothetical protein